MKEEIKKTPNTEIKTDVEEVVNPCSKCGEDDNIIIENDGDIDRIICFSCGRFVVGDWNPNIPNRIAILIGQWNAKNPNPLAIANKQLIECWGLLTQAAAGYDIKTAAAALITKHGVNYEA